MRGHEWEATIASRTQGNGCPSCHSATSALELRMLCEMKYLFKDVKHRARVYGQECDIFIPGLRIAIEYDGVYWHRQKVEHDKRKNVALRDKGITLIRVREKGLEKTSDTDIFISPRDSEFKVISTVVKRLREERSLSESARRSIGTYLKRNRLANDSEYERLLELLLSPLPSLSLQEQNPSLAGEWHPGRNGRLTAQRVSSSSNKKVWWKCAEGHEWQATISSRSQGNGCPYCAGKAVCEDNCLQFVNPLLAKEWHPAKNGNLTAEDVAAWSHKKVWWKCAKGHEWQATIDSRSRGNGCPYCAGKAVCEDNCLQVVNPVLAKEWHPMKNGELTAKDVTPGSNKKVWWKCPKGHEWSATIASRSGGRGCPYCAGKAASEDNCLETLNPVLAKEWHPTRNGGLTARDITPGSNKKVWWICHKGHEWPAIVADRSRGNGCPYCAGKRRLLP
jgi:very-short-patch-repair endonuclease